MTLIALIFSIVLGCSSLVFGYLSAGWMQFVRWIILFGALWFFAVWQRWRWFAYIGLLFNLLAAALGLWLLNFPPGWMFAGAIGGLMAFDLTDFRYRLRFTGSDDERRGLETRHLVRLSFLAILGMSLASLAMLVKLQFTFEWAIVLVVIVVLGLTQLIGWFRKRT
jgi:hypothetical protein